MKIWNKNEISLGFYFEIIDKLLGYEKGIISVPPIIDSEVYRKCTEMSFNEIMEKQKEQVYKNEVKRVEEANKTTQSQNNNQPTTSIQETFVINNFAEQDASMENFMDYHQDSTSRPFGSDKTTNDIPKFKYKSFRKWQYDVVNRIELKYLKDI